ncbi:MAG: pyridoxal phosphate-dependent aminotransferase [Anaeromyxobacter sp.]
MPRPPATSTHAAGLSANVYSALVERARSMPGPIYPLHVGDTWRSPPEGARAEDQREAEFPRLHAYAPVTGEPELVEAVREHLRARHGLALAPEQLQIMPGATGGLTTVLTALLDPGDELLLPSPFWPLIRGIAAARGCRVVEVPFFTRLGTPGFDPEAALERAVTPRTAAVYVNDPHNPTGRVLDDDTVAAIARVARRHDLWVVADAAYEDLRYGEARPPPWLRPELVERTIVSGTVSKSHAMAGARVGWSFGPEAPMRAVRGVQTFQHYCAARPMQRAAARALRMGEGWLAGLRREYAAAGAAAAAALGLPAPQGGTFLFADATPWLRPGEALQGFLERCLEAGVLLTPGLAAGQDFGSWVRLCFTAVPPGDLAQALRRLQPVLASGPGGP